ncbi:MAG: hypothetical protein LBE36_04270 [Flavobacteriaceae bacterium]|nr:hypothetical protein [Flavobacteriaceae bacterium]
MRKILNVLFLMMAIAGRGQVTENGYGGGSPSFQASIDMFPKSPQAAALSKFVDLPAGNYTGVADFTIPLYTIEFDGEKIPIELKYTTTGVKLSQIATREGLGWALNTGASLSKQIIGFQDLEFPRDVLPIGFNPEEDIADYPIADRAAGYNDMKPDIYTYSLLNKSGKFILNANGNSGIPMPYNQIKISPLSKNNVNMVDEKGIEYNFASNAIFGQRTRNTCTDPSMTPDNMYRYDEPLFAITKIKSPRNEEINYVYEEFNSVPYAKYVSSVSTRVRIDIQVVGPISTTWDMMALEPPPDRCVNYTMSKEPLLKEIQFKGGKILFSYSAGRDDIIGDVYLTGVIVKNDKNEVIKDFTLNYGYFVSPPGGLPSFVGNTAVVTQQYLPGVHKRLKLVSVKDNLTQGKYNLDYYDEYNGKTLPNRISNDQDYWGVYNGKNNEDKSISNSIYYPFPDNFESPYLGADKTADINYGKLGNLKKITYPTGGYSEIEYEADDFDLAIPEVIYDYNEDYYSGGIIDNDDSDSTYPSETIFTITDHPINRQITFSKTFGTDCYWKLEKTSGAWVGAGDSNITPRGDEPGEYKLLFTKGGIVQNDDKGGDNLGSNGLCMAEYTWTNITKTPIDTISVKKAGTIRVSKIQSIDNNSGKIVREYTYKEPSPNHILPYTKNSGKNLGEEMFISRSSQQFPINKFGTYAIEHIASDNPGWQTATVRGKPIGYDYVQEHYIDYSNPSNSYRKEYKFQNDETEGGGTYYQPGYLNVTFPIDGLDRGLLLEEILFDSSNKMVKKTTNEYNHDGHFNAGIYTDKETPDPGYFSVGNGLEIVRIQQISANGTIYHYVFDYATFPLMNYWILETKSTTTEYSNNGADSLQVVKTFNYSPNYKHTYPVETSAVGSLGETLKTKYKYPQDIPSTYMMQSLIDENRVSEPIVTNNYTNNIPTSETQILYEKFYPGTNEMILPKYIYHKKGETATAEDRKITYNSYDLKGNLTQYTLEDGIPVSVIWGYNQTLPIAKIEGAADYNALISAAADIILKSNNAADPASEQLLINALDTFRKNSALANYQVSTYTYDPLVGVKTVTPPSGIRENYFYDAAKRLEKVVDVNNKILKEYQYHYKQ